MIPNVSGPTPPSIYLPAKQIPTSVSNMTHSPHVTASFGPMLLPLTGAWGRLGLKERTFSCTILAKDGSSPKKALFAVGILAPCTIIATCYLLIYIRATRQRITTGRSRYCGEPRGTGQGRGRGRAVYQENNRYLSTPCWTKVMICASTRQFWALEPAG